MSFTTRFSVLEGVKGNDDESWEQFYAMYAPLIRMHGRDCGIGSENLEDLVQNVMLALTAQIPSFTYQPERGRFRDYLRKIIRARSCDMLRIIYKQERIPLLDGEEAQLDDLFDSEWEEHVRIHSLAKLKEEVSARHYQIFHMLDIQNRKVREVARMFKLPEATVYSIRNRTEEKLRIIADNLDV